MDEALLNKEQVARILNTTPRHVMDLARRGDLRSGKVGRLVRFRVEDVQSYIEVQVKKRAFG